MIWVLCDRLLRTHWSPGYRLTITHLPAYLEPIGPLAIGHRSDITYLLGGRPCLPGPLELGHARQPRLLHLLLPSACDDQAPPSLCHMSLVHFLLWLLSKQVMQQHSPCQTALPPPHERLVDAITIIISLGLVSSTGVYYRRVALCVSISDSMKGHALSTTTWSRSHFPFVW